MAAFDPVAFTEALSARFAAVLPRRRPEEIAAHAVFIDAAADILSIACDGMVDPEEPLSAAHGWLLTRHVASSMIDIYAHQEAAYAWIASLDHEDEGLCKQLAAGWFSQLTMCSMAYGSRAHKATQMPARTPGDIMDYETGVFYAKTIPADLYTILATGELTLGQALNTVPWAVIRVFDMFLGSK